MSLDNYNKKRNFQQTPEPQDDHNSQKVEGRFVVQCHKASHFHYDLRLQIGHSLKSWAIPKGPSLNPADQRLAVFVEDHPLAYADFEGVIPKGNYGAGTVMIWDEGTYLERSSDSFAISMQKSLEGLNNGQITFILDGKRLKGEFALIRMGHSRNWLLVKKWDSFASTKQQRWPETSIRSGLGFDEIRQSKKVWYSKQVGGHTPSSKKLYHTTIAPTLDEPELCSGPPAVKLSKPILSDQLVPLEGWTMEYWVKGVRGLLVINGHRSSFRSIGNLDYFARFKGLRHKIMPLETVAVLDVTLRDKDGNSPQFVVWDILFWQGKSFLRMSLCDRFIFREQFCSIYPLFKIPEPYSESHNNRNMVLLQRHTLSPYISGLTKTWVRGTMKRTESPQAVARKEERVPDNVAVTDQLSDLLVLSRSYDGPVRLAHGNKVLWPDVGISKAHLLGYYRLVAPYLIPYIKDCPLSVQRFPQGIQAIGFFQKDFVGFLPKYVKTHRVHSASSGKTLNYLLGNNEDTLLYLANLAVLEINPWLSRWQSLLQPAMAVIDLDPDGNPFQEVLELTNFIGKFLAGRGIVSYCKTSGASGVHIHVPLAGQASFDDSRTFCLAVAKRVQQHFPKLTSLERSPSRRRARIYLDCYQNRKSQTIVAPYSPRPLPGAPVSMPISWQEVEGAGVHPKQFNICTVASRLQQTGDLWHQIDRQQQNYTDLLARVTKS